MLCLQPVRSHTGVLPGNPLGGRARLLLLCRVTRLPPTPPPQLLLINFFFSWFQNKETRRLGAWYLLGPFSPPACSRASFWGTARLSSWVFLSWTPSCSHWDYFHSASTSIGLASRGETKQAGLLGAGGKETLASKTSWCSLAGVFFSPRQHRSIWHKSGTEGIALDWTRSVAFCQPSTCWV